MEYKEFYRRHLPHWQPRGAMMSLTYRLSGTIPREKLKALQDEYEKRLKAAIVDGRVNFDAKILAGKWLIIEIDKILDAAQYGPTWLANSEIAELISDNLQHHTDKLFRLWAYAIMPNHVHVLLQPMQAEQTTSSIGVNDQCDCIPIAKITHALKSYTSKQANKILRRSGRFWQDESYDHWVRDEEEFWRIIEYIEMNPVKAKLSQEPKDWRWSSAYERYHSGIDYLDPLPGSKT